MNKVISKVKWDKSIHQSQITNLMKYSQTIGIDTSKGHLDFSLYKNYEAHYLQRTNNELATLHQYIEQLGKEQNLSEILFCLETTGMYTQPFLVIATKYQLNVWLESALEISQSMGLKRGKNDISDSKTIAEYAFRNQDKAKLYQLPDKAMQEMKALLGLRKRLLESLKSIATPIKESKNFSTATTQDLIEKCSSNTITTLKEDIKQIEQELFKLLEENPAIKENYELTTSVTGVGKWTAFDVLLTTQNFTKFQNPKKYATYCGVIPFSKDSGKKKGRNRISFYAHKGMKARLHMCALAAVKHDDEIKAYYERKVEEGKAKLAVLNAIRNKIILRIFAVIKSRKKYEKRTLNDLETS